MSVRATNWAWSIHWLEPATKLVLMALADRATDDTDDGKMACNPSIARIMRDCNIRSRNTVKRHLEVLTDADIVRIEQNQRDDGSYTSNRYVLTMLPQDVDGGRSDIDPPPSSTGGRSDIDGGRSNIDPTPPNGWGEVGQLSDHANEPKGTKGSPLKSPQGVETSFCEKVREGDGEHGATTAPDADAARWAVMPPVLEAWQPGPELVDTLAVTFDIHRLAVLHALGTFKLAEASRGGRVRSYGVRFERWLKPLAKDMQARWWKLPARDWTVDDWRFRVFGDTPAAEVKRGSSWPTGKVMPHHMHKVREDWDSATMGPPPWHDGTMVPSVLMDTYAPWWDDKLAAHKAHLARLEVERTMADGKPVRIAPEWRPCQDEVAQIAEAFGLLGHEVMALAADYARYMSSEAARKKNIRVRSPYESFSKWVAKRAPDLKSARGGKPAACGGRGYQKAKGSDPVTGAEWRAFLGAVDDQANAAVKQRMWGTLLKDARAAAQVNPWQAFNGEIPPDVFADYAAAWGWVPVPSGAHDEVGRD